jgi:Sugar phosphate isomerases/epimerases
MINISGFTDEISGVLDEQLAVMKKLSQKYMCPRVIDGKNIADYTAEEFSKKILPRLEKAGVKFSSIGSPIGKVELSDEDGYRAQIEKLKNLVEIAKLTDCKYIRTFSFFVGKNCNYDECFPNVVEKIKGFMKVVEGTSVVLLHENEKKIFGDTPERVLKLYKAIDSPQYKLCFDASNYIQCGCDPWAAYQATKPYTVYYHMKDCTDGVEVPLGMGQGQIERILTDLIGGGYDGFLTLEPHTAKYAVLKKLFYVCPLFALAIKNSRRVFKEIDKNMGVKTFQSVSREEVYVWQFNNLKELLKKAGA